METTWKLKPGTHWHDGIPLTTADLVFTTEVGRELAAFNHQAYAAIDAVNAVDDRTLTINWKRAFISADALFSGNDGVTLPLPRHLLADAFLTDRSSFTENPFWTENYVGAGPFRLRSWVPTSQIVLEANSDYALGRPKLDEIEVRMIPDDNTRVANALAGEVDATIGSLGSIDQAITLRDQWRGGIVRFRFETNAWIAIFSQFVDPHPAIVGDARFRRALLYALDRQSLSDSLQFGMGPVGHSFMSPNQPAYAEIEAGLPHYDYEPRVAERMLAELGYTRGDDGVLRSAANDRLEVELRTGPVEQAARPGAAIADYWQRMGVATSYYRMTPQQQQDSEYRSTFPAFTVLNQANDVMGFYNLHSTRAPLPANRFRVVGGFGNVGRYMNSELDGLIDRYFMTVQPPERIQVLGPILFHIADQLPLMGIYYNPRPEAIAERLVGASRDRTGGQITWNAHEWDIR